MEEFDYAIIGGGLAGGNAAISIRENDAKGSILLLTDENHLPYDRVPLSKNYLYGNMPKDILYFKKQDFYKSQKIQILPNKKVITLDVQKKSISLEDNSQIHFKKLLLATGGHVRRLDIPGSNLKNVFYLRTIEDSDAIKEAMQTAKKAVVIGGGFIGCELAASFTKKGISTTIIEVGNKILGRVFDEETSLWLHDYFEKKGVKILASTIPKQFIEKDGKVVAVETQSGNKIEADFVAVGIGILPNVELAKNAGLKVDNGIWCNEYLQTPVPDVYVAGDVANFYSPIFGRHMRLEHYDLAIRHGKIAGANMAGQLEPMTDLPYFFSFMFDIRIGVYGDMGKYDTVIVRGNTDEGHFMKMYLFDGVVNAVMLVNSKEDLNSVKRLITKRIRFDDIFVLKDETVTLGEIVEA
ncbi:MAG: NAD(P)/FAD-dependent oxidoreductase [Nitrosotalea sp.]